MVSSRRPLPRRARAEEGFTMFVLVHDAGFGPRAWGRR